MRKAILTALTMLACSMLVGCPACVDFDNPFGPGGPGGINPDDPSGEPVPEIGEPVSLVIISESAIDAGVLARFFVGEVEVRRTVLFVPAGHRTEEIGPDLATSVAVDGAYIDGRPTPPGRYVLGSEFLAGELIEYVIADPEDECRTDDDCSDDDPCTTDTCAGGVCLNTSVDCGDEICDPATGECVSCLVDADCEDGDRCTTDTCTAGTCASTPVDCGDGFCDPATGVCIACLAPADCDDGDPCTVDSCTAGTCANTPVDCGDGFCDPATGACVDCLVDGDCDDADLCTVDHCAAGACANTPVDCGDGFCDPATGACVDCLVDDDCDDADLCTVDRCAAGACANTAVDCGDQLCDPATGACVDCLVDADCDDGDLCTADACTDGVCASAPVDCGDQLCDPDTGECVDCLVDGDCGDGVWCNGAEACVDHACVVGEPACADHLICREAEQDCVGCLADADCDDGDLCTTDACDDGTCVHTRVACGDGFCNPATGNCVACLVAAHCNDGVWCNGAEACVNHVCLAGQPRCEEGLFCREAEQDCVECLADADCDDGDLCTADTCTDGACASAPVDCGDQLCDPGTGECVDCLVDGDCDDGVWCNGAEACVDRACAAGEPPCPEDQVCREAEQDCVELILTGAVSRKPHGPAGTFDIDLPVNTYADTGIESRLGGPTQVILTFNGPAAGATVESSAGSVDAVVVDGPQVTVELSGVPNTTCLTLTVSGAPALAGETVVHIRCLEGDVTADGVVNVLDLVLVRNYLNQPVVSGNFRADVDLNGTVNILDKVRVRNRLLTWAACEPPDEVVACCLAYGACEDFTGEDCRYFGGLPQGAESSCETTECEFFCADPCDGSECPGWDECECLWEGDPCAPACGGDPVCDPDCGGDSCNSGCPDACNADLCEVIDCNHNAIADECEFGAGIVYVDASRGEGYQDGTTWETAYASLRDALAFAYCTWPPVTQIWVAAGIYTPDGDGERTASFDLLDDVAIYGGFGGAGSRLHPGGETELSQRNPALNITVLSGEIGDQEVPWDNSYHVVTAGPVTETAVLDGFVIAGGRADGDAEHSLGGGMLILGGGPTVANCMFLDNAAAFGGGLYSAGGEPAVINSLFSGNRAEGDFASGGAVYSYFGRPTFTSCTFAGNTASYLAGGIHALFSLDGAITNCILWWNLADTQTVEAEQIVVEEGPLAITYCNIQGWTGQLGGAGNIGNNLEDHDPRFVRDPLPSEGDFGDLRLQADSPCLDAGDNLADTSVASPGVQPLPLLDLGFQPRFVDDPYPDTGNGDPPIVDMGAFERQPIP